MRWIFTIAVVSTVGYGAWQWHQGKLDPVKVVQETLDAGQFPTLEIRHSAKQIMEVNRRDLIKDGRHRYLEAELKFYPYLLMEVKFSASKEKTKEGVILWDLVSGEMVLDTEDWDMTHGFSDCIKAATDKNEFKLLRTIAKKGGTCDRETIAKMLNVENDVLDSLLDSCRKKKLIVSSGNKYRIHIEKPILDASPETKLDEHLVTKSFKNATRVAKKYSTAQIQRMCKAAFGSDFVIRKTSIIFLPVHSIVVENPDGSVHTSHWNALNGKRLFQSFCFE